MVKNLEYKIVDGNLGAVRQLTEAGYRLQTVLELQNDRCKDGQEGLQNRLFYVADGSVFYQDPKNGAVSWAHTDGKHNLVIQPQYLERALKDLHQTYIFQPDNVKESWDVIKSRSTKRFALSDLRLVREDDEFSFMPIKTGRYDALSSVQQKAASLVGFTPKNVDYLKQKGIKDTRLWLLNPEYVALVLEEENVPFWRASWLKNFNHNSNFSANFRDINLNYCLRGVRREVIPEGDALKNKVPSAPQEVRLATFDEVRAYSACFVPDVVREQFELGLRQLYKS
ncbi:MAG TPA: hypothetical protein VJG31_04215 [Candidatus Nanoarchaeia archaeon]|nr:hypothetical protein [Candidatus Nanoarchaeia archaeon]